MGEAKGQIQAPQRQDEHLGDDDAAHRSSSTYCTAAAILGQSSICTRAISRYLPPSGLKMDASPSLTSNQSLPRASTIFGLCVMRMSFQPLSGALANMSRSALARLLFSSGVTTRPPSERSAVVSMFLNP